MPRLRTRGVVIDTALLEKDLRALPGLIQQEAMLEGEKALKTILQKLNENSGLRQTNVVSSDKYRHSLHIAAGNPTESFTPTGYSAGTKDRPFKTAKVVHIGRDPKTAGLGNLRLNIYVQMDDGEGNNLFNILDAGMEPRIQHGNPTFPVYTRRATRPMTEYDPKTLDKYFQQPEFDISEETGRIKMVTLPEGHRMQKRTPPRTYYEAVARYVREVLIGRKYPINGKYVKIDEKNINLITVRVSDGARLKKIEG